MKCLFQSLFVADSQTNKLLKAEIKDGKPGPMIEIADVSKYGLAVPDGLAISGDGRIFQALYGNSEKLLVLDPDGNAIGYLPTGPLTSNCVFAEDGTTLYVTADKKLMRVKFLQKNNRFIKRKSRSFQTNTYFTSNSQLTIMIIDSDLPSIVGSLV